MGNLDLHLIKGRPAVHSDDDLIVSHIAITVTDMKELTNKLKALNVKWRKNISVPNPSDKEIGIVNQVITSKITSEITIFHQYQIIKK
jgi:hypothetical protein